MILSIPNRLHACRPTPRSPSSRSAATSTSRSRPSPSPLGIEKEATGYENIRLRGLIAGLRLATIRKITPEIAEFSGLGDYLSMPVRTYSTGMVMRLSFSIDAVAAADMLARHKAANWVGRGRVRNSTRPGANGVVELTPFEFLDGLADLSRPRPAHRLGRARASARRPRRLPIVARRTARDQHP